MKKKGTMVSKDENGEFKVSNLERGWYTFYVQTDKRDYFNLQVYLYNQGILKCTYKVQKGMV